MPRPRREVHQAGDDHTTNGDLDDSAPNDSDRTQYIDAATRQAFVVDDDSVEDGGRAIVHCFSGSLGADWDLEAVVKAIELAESVCWTDTFAAKILGHSLEVVTTDGRTLLFQVRRTDS